LNGVPVSVSYEEVPAAPGKAPLVALEPVAFPTVTRTLQINASFVVADPEHDARVRSVIDQALAALHAEAATFQHKHEIVK
jgi:hypothetical protein